MSMSGDKMSIKLMIPETVWLKKLDDNKKPTHALFNKKMKTGFWVKESKIDRNKNE